MSAASPDKQLESRKLGTRRKLCIVRLNRLGNDFGHFKIYVRDQRDRNGRVTSFSNQLRKLKRKKGLMFEMENQGQAIFQLGIHDDSGQPGTKPCGAKNG